jgi:hypothetical protein
MALTHPSSSAGFEAVNLESNGKHTNHQITEVDLDQTKKKPLLNRFRSGEKLCSLMAHVIITLTNSVALES